MRGQVRQVLGWALSLTFQHEKTVTLMSELAAEFAGTRQLPDLGCGAALAGTAAYYSGEDRLCQRVLALLATLNGGQPPWQAGGRSDRVARVHALWSGTAVAPLTDRAAKLSAIRELLAGQIHGDQYTPLAAAALLAGDPRQAVLLRDQVDGKPGELSNGPTLMVITWALLDTGQWDDALEYAGRARTLAAVYPEPAVRASVTGAAAYIAACRGHSAAAAEDAMSVIGIAGLSEHSGMLARAQHAMGMAALTADRPDEAYGWLRRLVTADGRAAHYRESLFGLIDLAEAARRTGREAEAG